MTESSRKTPWGWIIGGGVAVLALVLGAVFFIVIPNSIESKGNQLEQELSAVYLDGANILSNCVTTTSGAAQVASANAAAFDKVIQDAIVGTGAVGSVDLNNPVTARNTLMPLLVQAFPDMAGQTALFDKVLNTMLGCRDDFKNKQSVVLDKVRQFDTWRTGSWFSRTFGASDFPNENLVVTMPGGTVLTGDAAMVKIRTIIVEGSVVDTYDKGTFQAPTLFPSAPTTPAR